MIRLIFIIFFLFGCSTNNPRDLLKPLTSDNKLAFTLYNYNLVSCRADKCLKEDAYQELKYRHELNKEVEAYIECPVHLRVFICRDLHQPENKYILTPAEWQRGAQFIMHYFHTQCSNP